MVFLPPEKESQARKAIEALAQQSNLQCLGWREVPVETVNLGSRALSTQPAVRQCFFTATQPNTDLDRALYFFRKLVEAQGEPGTYFCSLSTSTVFSVNRAAPGTGLTTVISMIWSGIRIARAAVSGSRISAGCCAITRAVNRI